MVNERNLALAQMVIEIMAEIGKTPSQFALAWLLAQGPSVIPIIGSRKAHQLDEVSKITLGFPHEFLQMPVLRAGVTAGNDDAIIKR